MAPNDKLLKRAIEEVSVFVEDAEDFIESELEESWDAAERYYRGETDLEEIPNRSNVTKTEVRDAIRNMMPSIMRILLQARKIVEYMPSSVQHAAWVEQQSEYVTQLFWECRGYTVLYCAILEALKLKIGILKVHWLESPKVSYERYTAVPFEIVEMLLNDPMFEVKDYEPVDNKVTQMGNRDAELYNVEGERYEENGKIVLEGVPNYEFFISRNATSVDHAIESGVHGQRGIVTVSEALEMGIPDTTDWAELDAEDPEQSGNAASSQSRRGYVKQAPNDPPSEDILKHEFLLTEAYASYDLEGSGQLQLYKFFLGGTQRKYLHHERVEDSPYSILTPNIIPFTVYGDSVADLTINEQDTSSSLLRALVDNAHAANGVKIAADPKKTSFDDLVNPALNAPVRKRSDDTLQVMQVPFTGQGNLATLQYLDRDVENKIGITKAATGLDPNALQSTDKDAVLNTIRTSQGQPELVVRNIVETGLTRVFKLLLRLSIRHHSPIRLMQSKGKQVPINITAFDPDATAIPNVGLGSSNPEQTVAALNFIYNEQQKVMQQHGPNNPFTSFAQIYNTLEDLLEAMTIKDVGRYFNVVTPDVERRWAEAQQNAQAAMAEYKQKQAPMDPSKAFLITEAEKNANKRMELLLRHQKDSQELSLRALTEAEKADLERDKLVQDREIKTAQVGIDPADIKQEQEGNDTILKRTNTGGAFRSSRPAHAKPDGRKKA